MTGEQLRIITALGVLAILLLLRLQAEQFGAAEYMEPSAAWRGGRRPGRRWGGLSTRLAWYGLALGLLLLVYTIHPQPHDVLGLMAGQHFDVFFFGALLAAAGVGQAAAYARFRYGDLDLRLPRPEAYPEAALNAVATALIDEAAFRGAVQGTLLAAEIPWGAAVVIQSLLYVLVTRAAAPGRSLYTAALAAGMGLAFGWATYFTGGIGAAILAHVATTFAIFVFTGHAGQVPRFGDEPEEVADLHRPPGWVDALPGGAAVAGGARPHEAAPGGAAGRPAGGPAAGPAASGGRVTRLDR
jgi:membrane protease YdiL (CAAX protease family)